MFHRVTGDSKRGRQLVSKKHRARSKYMPHVGAKEQERAKRCYMHNGVLHQFSKRQHEAIQRAGRAEYESIF